MEKKEKNVQFLQVSDAVFIPKEKLKNHPTIITENVCDCVLAVVQNEKGAVIYHRFKDDKSKLFTGYLKENLAGGGDLKIAVYGGILADHQNGYNSTFIEKNKGSYKNTNLRSSEEDEQVIDFIGEEIYEKGLTFKEVAEKIKEYFEKMDIDRFSGKRNMDHLFQAIHKSGESIKEAEHLPSVIQGIITINFDKNGKISTEAFSDDDKKINNLIKKAGFEARIMPLGKNMNRINYESKKELRKYNSLPDLSKINEASNYKKELEIEKSEINDNIESERNNSLNGLSQNKNSSNSSVYSKLANEISDRVYFEKEYYLQSQEEKMEKDRKRSKSASSLLEIEKELKRKPNKEM